MKMTKAILLFSGGLDSIIAAKLLQKQGISLYCVHFVSPFFGQPQMAGKWKKAYGLDIACYDLGHEFIKMLKAEPEHGFGKNLNPCIDCKILIFKKARQIMQEQGADFLASGEVLGQRPMSQRRDALNLIQNSAGIAGFLVRPLSAKLLRPTIPEINGLIERERFLDISGRNRSRQLALAKELNIFPVPAPAGGCNLADPEKTRRYWHLLKHSRTKSEESLLKDCLIANTGRFLCHGTRWMVIGRNQADNEKIRRLKNGEDALIKIRDFAGPIALAREGDFWSDEEKRSACEVVASYAPQALGKKTRMLWNWQGNEEYFEIVSHKGSPFWTLPDLQQTYMELKAFRRRQLENKAARRRNLPALVYPEKIKD